MFGRSKKAESPEQLEFEAVMLKAETLLQGAKARDEALALAEQNLKDAVDVFNDAWTRYESLAKRKKLRPWLDWGERILTLSHLSATTRYPE